MANGKNSSQFVGFEVDGQIYAFRIEQIQEIVILDQVTKAPQVPHYVDGVANLRGSIIPIINLRKLFGLSPKPADADTRTIVVNIGTRTMGCTVDSVSQVMRIPEENIQSAPETVKANGAGELLEIAIDPRAVDPDDPEMLADMVLAAANEALRAATQAVEAKLRGQLPDLGALGLPGM